MLDDILSRLLRTVDGARAALLVGLDGIVVAGPGDRQDSSWEILVASYADLMHRLIAANREAEMGAPAELVVVSPSAVVALRLVTADYGLLMVLEPGGSLGRARFELRKAADRVLPELPG